jgi:hypothetical protein
VIDHSTLTNVASLKPFTSLLVGKKRLRATQDGFRGLDGARRLLNDMIHESMTKYDEEIAKCTDYYAQQCALMAIARGQISASNYLAANSRALILDASATIDRCERDIPNAKQGLKNHNRQCKGDIQKSNAHLKQIMGDIAVMTMILKMTDCDKKSMLQVKTEELTMRRCKDQCSKKASVTFSQDSLQKQVGKLKLPSSQERIAEAFSDLFDGVDAADSFELVQVASSEHQIKRNATKPTKTQFNNPPVPKTKVPGDPCTDPNMGAPGPAVKRAAKCTLKKSPQCYKLQGRFLQIQAGIADDRDELMEDIAKLEASCDETKKTMETTIDNDNALLSESQTKLAIATEKEANAGENARQVAKENKQYNSDLVKQMKSCSSNYINFETELCSLRKIRGELFKKMDEGHSGFFQDCEVSKWAPEECTKKCAGGEQKLSRSVLTHPNGGAKCLPLTAEKSCNLHPCPVNCKLSSWGGWSKCSAECGGGLQQRVRDVERASKFGGKPCGAESQAVACNIAACEKNCELHEWTKWTTCSKDCDGGTKKRQRMIKEPAQGSGKCPGAWDIERLKYKKCNTKRCQVTNPNEVMKCNKTMDVVLVLDGTPKSGRAGWNAEVRAANLLVDAFAGEGMTAKPHIAVVHFSGPRTWSGVSRCTGKSTKKVDMENTCHVKIASHFTGDLKTVKNTINGLEFKPGAKLLSLALMTTQAELALGRQSARSTVVVFVDGQPLSYRKTMMASENLRKKARLVYVPVIKFSPLKEYKKWASRRWQENIVQVSSAIELSKPEVGTHIVANICPKSFPKLQTKSKLD